MLAVPKGPNPVPAAADLRTSRLSDWNRRFVVEERFLPAETRRRLYLTSVALVAIGLTAFLILVVNVMTHTGYEHLDVPVER